MRLVEKVSEEIQNLCLYSKVATTAIQPSVQNNVSYVSQFANPDWSEKVLKDGLSIRTDPDWAQSGADTLDEYEQWATTVCGMACTVMALRHFYGRDYAPIALAKDALVHGVYKEQLGGFSAMYYKEYVAWVSAYGLSAQLYSRLSVAGIRYVLASGGLVIASVNSNIRGYNIAPEKQKGGHLVLVTGYDIGADTITIQNPSGFVSSGTQHNHVLQTADFIKYFAQRGIALYTQ